MKLHPQLIERNGKKEFVVLPYDEFLTLEELLHDYEDLQDLRSARAESKDELAIPIDQVIEELNR